MIEWSYTATAHGDCTMSTRSMWMLRRCCPFWHPSRSQDQLARPGWVNGLLEASQGEGNALESWTNQPRMKHQHDRTSSILHSNQETVILQDLLQIFLLQQWQVEKESPIPPIIAASVEAVENYGWQDSSWFHHRCSVTDVALTLDLFVLGVPSAERLALWNAFHFTNGKSWTHIILIIVYM